LLWVFIFQNSFVHRYQSKSLRIEIFAVTILLVAD